MKGEVRRILKVKSHRKFSVNRRYYNLKGNIIVLHHRLNKGGGTKRVCLAVIDALLGEGYNVTLYTWEKTNWEKVKKFFGKEIKVKEKALRRRYLQLFGIYQRPFTGLFTYKLRKKADLVINTFGDMIFAYSDLTYIHDPFAMLRYRNFKEHSEYSVDFEKSKYAKSLFWKLYFKPYELVHKRILNHFTRGSMILTNSKYSSWMIKKCLNRKAHVLYPPVDIEFFRVTSFNKKNKNIVLSVGRFDPKKRYELIPVIAKKCKDAKFIIAGSLDPKNFFYFRKIKKLIAKYKVQNVKLIRDASLLSLKELFTMASIYLHLMVSEHFGIAVVESMSAGCIPVVHRSGGPWMDIADMGKYAFGYDTIDECANMISELISKSDEQLDSMRVTMQKRAQAFSADNFKKGLLKIVHRLV